jgi:hypothetical protein
VGYPSTFLDLQNTVIGRLRLHSTNDLQKVKDAINQVYAEISVECEAVQNSATMTLTVNEASYLMPPEVMRIKVMHLTPAGSTNYNHPMYPVSLEQILEWRSGGISGQGSGQPSHYAHIGYQQLEVYPTPNSADTITIYYVGLPTALGANGDIPVIQEPYASQLLEYGALAELGDFLHHPSTIEYRQLFEDWKRRFRSHINSRKRGAGVLALRVGQDFYPPHDPSTDLRAYG